MESKLSLLSESSSKESILTLAKWIGFNRKHAAAFGPILARRLSGNTATVTLSVISQVLLLDKEDSKQWDKLSDFRLYLGENVLIPHCKPMIQNNHHNHNTNNNNNQEKVLQQFLKEWDEANVFGGPTLINQLKREILAATTTTTTTNTTTTTTTTSTPVSSEVQHPESLSSTTTTTTTEPEPIIQLPDSIMEDQEEEETPLPTSTTTITQEDSNTATNPKENTITLQTNTTETSFTTTTTTTIPSTTKKQQQLQPQQPPPNDLYYDFESKGIPREKVSMKQLQDPCRAVATLQIARDLRHDSAVQLAAILAELPLVIRQRINNNNNNDNNTDNNNHQPWILEEDKARDLSIQTNELTLDMDIPEQLSNLRIYKEIMEKQGQARRELIRLLIQSRCQFGNNTNDNSATDHDLLLSSMQASFIKRKNALVDAMDLEGLELDFELKERSEAADLALQQLQNQHQQQSEPQQLPSYNNNKKIRLSSQESDE